MKREYQIIVTIPDIEKMMETSPDQDWSALMDGSLSVDDLMALVEVDEAAVIFIVRDIN